MPKSRTSYSPEFRRQMVEFVHAGRDPDELAREFEPTGQSIRVWVASSIEKVGRHVAGNAGLAGPERDELVHLRRENKELRLERDILSVSIREQS